MSRVTREEGKVVLNKTKVKISKKKKAYYGVTVSLFHMFLLSEISFSIAVAKFAHRKGDSH